MENEINIDLNKHEALNDHGDLSDHGDLNDHRHLNYAITRTTMETLTSLLNDHGDSNDDVERPWRLEQTCRMTIET